MARAIALLFSGQGAQQIGMGKDLSESFAVAANRFAETDAELGYSLSQIAFHGPIERLTQTSQCQIALYAHGLAVLDVLRDQLGPFEFKACAGLSLGEFTAHTAAGTFDFITGLRLVANRGRYMEDACRLISGGMAAFVGGDADAVRKLATDTDLDIANLNSPGQIALSGPIVNIQKAIELAKSYGIRRAVPLNVAGAFHSRWMKQAEEKLRRDLAEAQIAPPRATVISNVTARPAADGDQIRRTLAEQVSGSVRWVESVEYLLDRIGCDLFVELGPSEVVAGLVNRIRKGAKVISIGDMASLEAGLRDLKEEVK